MIVIERMSVEHTPHTEKKTNKKLNAAFSKLHEQLTISYQKLQAQACAE